VTARPWPSGARGAVLDALGKVDRPTLPRLTTAALKALAPFYRAALEESEDDERLRERMATLLRGTANALKGDPPPLTAHNWADLPKVAAALRAEVAVAERRGADALVREALGQLDRNGPVNLGLWLRARAAESAAGPDTPGAARPVVPGDTGGGIS
jgi:hypothetical protein